MTSSNGKALAKVEGSRKPWERIPGEGERAYTAFTHYRDLGSERNLRRVGQDLGKSRQAIEELSHRWNWVERVLAYDDHLDQQALATVEKEYRRMALRQARLGMRLQGYGDKEITRLESQDEELDADTARKLIATGAQLERDSRELLKDDENPLEALQAFEQIVLQAIEDESPEAAARIRERLQAISVEKQGNGHP
jgi:hypothetical protein